MPAGTFDDDLDWHKALIFCAVKIYACVKNTQETAAALYKILLFYQYLLWYRICSLVSSEQGEITMNTVTRFSTGFTILMILVLPGYIAAQNAPESPIWAPAALQALRVQAILNERELGLAQQIADSYYQLGFIEHSLRINDRLSATISRLLGQTETRYATGEGLQQVSGHKA